MSRFKGRKRNREGHKIYTIPTIVCYCEQDKDTLVNRNQLNKHRYIENVTDTKILLVKTSTEMQVCITGMHNS